MTERLGISPTLGRKFANQAQMHLTRCSSLEQHFKASSVGHFFNIPAELIDEHDRMACSQGLRSGAKTGSRRRLSKILGENADS